MHFAFTEDQLAIRDAIGEALTGECTPAVVRAAWQEPPAALWAQLAGLGATSINVPEEYGGLGLGPLDWVLVLEEAGRVCAPLPLAETVAVVPALVEAGRHDLVERIAAGEGFVTAMSADGFAVDADRAALVLVVHGREVVALEGAELTAQQSIDGGRRLFSVTGGRAQSLSADGESLSHRAALATAAELIGLARTMLEMSVAYAKAREQFGKPIGSFQAIHHHLADALMQIEFAAPTVYRAAWSLSAGDPARDLHVSMAKAMAAEAARLSARKALQVHGAIGYTTEFDLHLWLKRTWALSGAWGDAPTHRNRLAATILE